MKRKIDLTLLLVGALGLIILSINILLDTDAQSGMEAAIAIQILFATMFISGYNSLSKKD